MNIKKKLIVLFFMSGFAGLVYQVVCVRLLGNIFGNATYAVTTVLAGFMGGMALGSWFFGALVDSKKQSPLYIYSMLEAGTGIYILFSFLIFSGINELYSRIGIIENTSLSVMLIFIIGFIAVFIPTFLIGGMFPVMSKFFNEYHSFGGKLGFNVGLLYSVNTLGAALGSFLAGYLLIMFIGVKGTLYFTATVNFVIAITVFIQARTNEFDFVSGKEPKITVDKEKPGRVNIILLVAGLSGLTALSYEVVWTRILSMVLGSTVYAFATMLCAFLMGLAIGGAIYAAYEKKSKILKIEKQITLYGYTQAAIGLSVLLLIPVFGFLPIVFLNLFNVVGDNFTLFQGAQFLLVFAVMIIPTTLFGITLPLACSIYRNNYKNHKKNSIPGTGISVGRIYSADTIGAVIGTLATGFALIPLIGIQRTVITISFINIVLALVLLNIGLQKNKIQRSIVTAAVIFFVVPYVFALPEWNKQVLASGIYNYALTYRENIKAKNITSSDIWEFRKWESEILYYKEGTHFTVSVEESADSGIRTLRIDGKVDASNNVAEEMETHVLLSDLPVMMHGSPRKSLVIGLGSGITLGSMTKWETIETINCVEIEPAMIEASRFFNQWSGDPLNDERINIIINDARSYLNATRQTYDVISSVPSNPWMAGSAQLFTKEFFETVKYRLNSGGVFGAWMQRYAIHPKDYALVLKTIDEVFENVFVWNVSHSDSLIIASEDVNKIDFNKIKEMFENAENNYSQLLGIETPYDLLSRFVIGPEKIKRITGSVRGVNSDNRPLLEFSAARNMYLDTGDRTHQFLNENRESPANYIIDFEGNLELAEAFIKRNDFTLALSELKISISSGQKLQEAYNLSGYCYLMLGDVDTGMDMLHKSLDINPKDEATRINLSQAYLLKENIEKAEGILKEIIKDNPDYIFAYNNLGDIYIRTGRIEQADVLFREAISRQPDFLYPYLHLGRILLENKNNPLEAKKYMHKALERYPESADAWYILGHVYLRLNRAEQAEGAFNRAMRYDERYVSILLPEARGIVTR